MISPRFLALLLSSLLAWSGSLRAGRHWPAAPVPAGSFTLAPAPAPARFHPPMALPPAAAAAADVCDTDNNTFAAGEVITYKLYYNWGMVWLSAGEVTFKVHELPAQYHVTVTGETYDSYEWFYQVRDRYESYLNKETLLPELHIKDIQEGGYTRYDRTRFDQVDHVATSDRGRTRYDLSRETIAFNGCMHDLISIVYWARNLDYATMRPDQEIPITILMDRKIYPLRVKYLGREARTKVKGVGVFNTQKFSPQLIAGDVFKEGDEMKIYVTDDRNRIPVLIESPVVVGSVKAVLHRYSGLKYPVEARAK